MRMNNTIYKLQLAATLEASQDALLESIKRDIPKLDGKRFTELCVHLAELAQKAIDQNEKKK
jgi:hypothetical protein